MPSGALDIWNSGSASGKSCLTKLSWPVQLPMDAENAGTRKKAIALLQAMLGQPQRAGQPGSKQPLDAEFLQTALSRLTAGELVQLYDWPAFASQTTTIPW